MYEEQFSERLARLRTRKGTSARDMSLSIGQNPGYINNIEIGKAMPSMSAFFYICEYLEIEPRDFFDFSTEYPQQVSQLTNQLKKLDFQQLTAISTIVSGLLAHK